MAVSATAFCAFCVSSDQQGHLAQFLVPVWKSTGDHSLANGHHGDYSLCLGSPVVPDALLGYYKRDLNVSPVAAVLIWRLSNHKSFLNAPKVMEGQGNWW